MAVNSLGGSFSSEYHVFWMTFVTNTIQIKENWLARAGIPLTFKMLKKMVLTWAILRQASGGLVLKWQC